MSLCHPKEKWVKCFSLPAGPLNTLLVFYWETEREWIRVWGRWRGSERSRKRWYSYQYAFCKKKFSSNKWKNGKNCTNTTLSSPLNHIKICFWPNLDFDFDMGYLYIFQVCENHTEKCIIMKYAVKSFSVFTFHSSYI